MDATVYRVSPGPKNTWRVSVGAAGAIATFDGKSAAVRYALSLARGEVHWHLPAGASPPGGSSRHLPTRLA